MIENDAAAPISASTAFTLEHIVTVCGSGTCPTVYRTGRGTLVVQGYVVSGEHAGVNVPDGELLVEIPAELLNQAAAAVV